MPAVVYELIPLSSRNLAVLVLSFPFHGEMCTLIKWSDHWVTGDSHETGGVADLFLTEAVAVRKAQV